MIDQQFKDIFSTLIQTQISNGKTKLDVNKIATYLTSALGYEVTADMITSISDQFPFIRDVTGNILTVADAPDSEEELVDDEESDEDIHDIAVDQAKKDMFEAYTPFRTLAEALEKLTPKSTIKYDVVNFKDTLDNAYLMHYASRKEKPDYIVESVVVKNANGFRYSDSIVKCKIKGTNIHIDLPITSIIK